MSARTRTRIGAIGTCVLLAMTVPAMAVAAAQPSTAPAPSTGTPADPNVAGGKPPPIDPNWQPKDTSKPDEQYTMKSNTGCVSSLSDGKIVLKDAPWGQSWLQIREAQKFTMGDNVTVAVIDTGVSQHPYLSGRLISGGDYVNPPDKGLSDCDGHGTEVAGIIAGDPNNSDIGFIGVAPHAKILSIRQSSGLFEGPDASNPGQTRAAGTLDTLAMAIIHATKAGVGVINMSVDNCRAASSGLISTSEQNLQGAVHYAVEHNVVLVASAGNLNEDNGCNQNNGPDPNKPQTIVLPPWFSDDVISVAAMDDTGDPASFSMHGPWVTVAAPGTKITSLDPSAGSKCLTSGSRCLANQTSFQKSQKSPIDGTSFAAPYVAGVAALVRSRYPNLNARQVMTRIEQTAQHPGAPGGRDDIVGYGMVDPVAALTRYIPSESGVAPATPTNLGPQLPPGQHRDWLPMQIALAGTGGGLGLLLLTLFAVHTVRRNRRPATR